jgi:hypothetical protein
MPDIIMAEVSEQYYKLLIYIANYVGRFLQTRYFLVELLVGYDSI